MAAYTPTPVMQDQYTSFLLGTIDETYMVQEVPRTFQSFFGPSTPSGRTVLNADDTFFQMDVMRAGPRSLAPMIPRNMISRSIGDIEKPINGVRFTSVKMPFPLVHQEGVIGADLLNQRVFGEPTSMPYSKQERAQFYAGKITNEIVARAGRLYEYLATQVVLLGTMPSIIGNTDTETVYDFRKLATHVVDKTGTPWSTVGTSILTEIDTACDLNEQDGHLDSDYLLCAYDVPATFLTNTQLLAMGDIRRYYNFEFNGPMAIPDKFSFLVNGGAIPFAKLVTPKQREIFCFVTRKFYHNSSGTLTYYMPAGYAVIGSSMASGHQLFGPGEARFDVPSDAEIGRTLLGIDVEGTVATDVDTSRPFVPESIAMRVDRSPDRKSLLIQAESAPVFMPLNPNALTTYYNLV